MKKNLVILTLAGALLGGCSALEKTNAAAEKVANVTQSTQTYVDINSVSGKEFTLENADITITFETAKVYGFSGVNRYFGSIKVDGNKIAIENVASTMMAGTPAKMEEESNYLKALAEVNSISIDGNTVTLSGNGKTLKFLGK